MLSYADDSESSGESLGPVARLLVSLLVAAASCSEGSAASKCMAEFCLKTPVTQEDIVAKYGPGRRFAEASGPDHKYVRRPTLVQRCYYDPKQDLYVEFGFDKHQRRWDKHQQRWVTYNSDQAEMVEIMVSSVPMCPKKYTPKQPFPPFKTEVDISVGATDAEVRASMGMQLNMIDNELMKPEHFSHEELMREYEATEYGEKGLYYAPDPDHDHLKNIFYISQGKVKSILLRNYNY